MAGPNKKEIPLSIVMNAMDKATDEWNHYLDTEDMKIASIPEDAADLYLYKEDDKLLELIKEDDGSRFCRLPNKYDINEYGIMQNFILSLPEGSIQDSLESAVRGRGAFRRFQEGIKRHGIEQSWYDFERESHIELAKAWCEKNGLSYIDDIRKKHMKLQANVGFRDPLAWEEVSCEHLIQDEWIDFRRSVYRFPDGSVFEPYYSYSRRDYVVIVASDEDGNYLCVRQFRQGIKEVTTEFPAGGIEREDGKEYGSSQDISAEDAFYAAKRELLEETGYESDEWEHLLTVPSNATIADNYGHLFMAKNCHKVSNQELDDTEFLNVITLAPNQIEDLIATGKFQQAIHITAWLLSLRR